MIFLWIIQNNRVKTPNSTSKVIITELSVSADLAVAYAWNVDELYIAVLDAHTPSLLAGLGVIQHVHVFFV